MSTITYPSGIVGPLPPAPPLRYTVDEFQQLVRSGGLPPARRCELIEGWIIQKMSRNPPHDVCIEKSQDCLRAVLPPGWRLRVHSAVTTPDSQPQPDFAVVPGPADRYSAHHPTAADIATLIEVADTTLRYDRTEKGRVYARAEIGIYWIINLVDRQVEVYTNPTGPGVAAPVYQDRQDFGENESVPLVIGGHEVGRVAVRDLLPS
jgi:Uma2 family endonuclease